MTHLRFLLLIVPGLINVSLGNTVPVVTTSYGDVQGVFESSEDGDNYLYMGIPYAKVPQGNMFGDPLNAEPWNGVYQANDDSIKCPQREEFNNTLTGTLDCLVLNVYVPVLGNQSEPLPVYVWMFGGENAYGFAGRYQWGPERLTAQEVIVVTINYRTGVFGFTCLDIEEVPGNAGFKDITFGLRWIRDNIARFGGDPNQVTIGGCSSGSYVVEYLIASPMTTGLFHRAVMESGSATAFSVEIARGTEYITELAALTGYEGEANIRDAWQYLNYIPTDDIVVAYENLGITLGGCAEKVFEGVEAFMTESPILSLPALNFTPVDVLVGFNNEELLCAVANVDLDESAATLFNASALIMLTFEDDFEKAKIGNELRYFYIGDEELSNDNKYDYVDCMSDYAFIYPGYRSALIHAERATVYYYEFSYDGNHNFVKKRNNVTMAGACHADQISYTFRQDKLWESLGIEENETDKLVAERMTTMWMNFVKYGNPTPEVTDLLPVTWLPFSKDVKNYMQIDDSLSLQSAPIRQRMVLWNLLYMGYFKGIN